MRRLACVLAALLAPGAAGGQSTDPLTPLRDSGRPGWTAAWGPLAGLNADQRVLPSAPELPGLLDAPAPRVGQFWSAANPAALAYEVTGSWGEIRLRKGGERGTHRRPLDAADYGIRQFSGLRWQPLGGRSAVVGQVTADETISDAGSLSPFLVRHSPDPFAVTDAMTPPMRHIRVRAEGAYGWRAGPWGFGAGLGLEVSDDRSMETRTPRLGRTSAPALSFGLLRVLDAGFTVSAHGRWIGAHENSRIAVPRGTEIVVRELDGFGEPQPLRVAGPDIFGRSVGRARRTAGAALSGRMGTWQWVARSEHEDIGHEHESSRLSTDPPNRWEAGTWRIGLDVLGHAGPLRAAVSAVYTTLDGDAFRRDLVGQGAIFRVRQTAFLGRVDLRMPLTDSAWIAAVRVSVRRESRLRHDFLIAAASDLRIWHPGISFEISRNLSEHAALSAGGGASGYQPAGHVPGAGVFGDVDPVLVAPELALYSARARAYTASVAIRVRLARGPALVTRGRFERLVPVARQAQPGERRSLWSVTASAIWEVGGVGLRYAPMR